MPIIWGDGPAHSAPVCKPRALWSLVLEGFCLFVFGGAFLRVALALAESLR